jgi:hypothetical protein
VSKFLEEMATEAEIRVRTYKAERDSLTKAAARIAELDALIEEAEGEVVSFKSRLPTKEEVKEVSVDPR